MFWSKSFNEKNASNRLEILETLSGRATIGIAIGIAIEIGVLYCFHRSNGEFWWTLVANLLIGTGLIVEYFCIRATIVASKEHEAEMDEQLTRALDRASNAETALAKFLTTRRKILATESSNIITAIKPFEGTVFDSAMSHFEREVGDFLWDIEVALIAAGWQQINWDAPPNTMTIARTNRKIAGQALAQNVEIELAPASRQALLPAAEALISALKAVGIDASEAPYNLVVGNPQAIHLLVGPKR